MRPPFENAANRPRRGGLQQMPDARAARPVSLYWQVWENQHLLRG
jgi:hypothetical protein